MVSMVDGSSEVADLLTGLEALDGAAPVTYVQVGTTTTRRARGLVLLLSNPAGDGRCTHDVLAGALSSSAASLPFC